VWFTSANVPLRRKGGDGTLVNADVSNVDLTQPVTAGLVSGVQGRLPKSSNEILLSQQAARDFTVNLGDSLTFVHPEQTFTVVGIARGDSSDGFGNSAFDIDAPGFDFGSLRPGLTAQSALLTGEPWRASAETSAIAVAQATGLNSNVGFSGDPNAAETLYLTKHAAYVSTVDALDLATRWVFGTLALIVLGVIVGAAFAVSGRRQLVIIGQLSAQGATARTMRRFLALQGTLSGVGGVVIGLVAGREIWTHTDSSMLRPANWSSAAGSVRDLVIVALTAIVVATAAAALPSRSLTRTSVLTALGGRRPVGQLPKRLFSIGVALFAVGVLILGLAMDDLRGGHSASGPSALAGLGTCAMLVALFCWSPLIVRAVGRLAARRPGAARLAARSLVRHRARSSALLVAIIAVGGSGMVLATFNEHRVAISTAASPGLAANVFTLGSNNTGLTDTPATSPLVAASQDPALALPSALSDASKAVPGVRFVPTQLALDATAFAAALTAANLPTGTTDDGVTTGVTLPASPPSFALIDTRNGEQMTTSAVVASDELLDALQLDPAGRDALRVHGAMFAVNQDSRYGQDRNGEPSPGQFALTLSRGAG
ncbi:MAG TPA: FtsX-like permease family protein, partial [Ilumatobacteraceae bacterium]